MTEEERELILRHFKLPDLYSKVGEEKWERVLEEALVYDCDWLERFQDAMNPIPAEVIKNLCEKIEEQERKIEIMESQLEVLSLGEGR